MTEDETLDGFTDSVDMGLGKLREHYIFNSTNIEYLP